MDNVPEAGTVLGGTYTWPAAITGLNPPRASFYVFTTAKNPFGTDELLPLYRLGFADTCDWRNTRYVTSMSQVRTLEASGDACPSTSGSQPCKLDGIEGFILATCPTQFSGCNNFTNPSVPQPLYRAYNSTDNSYALILGSQLANSAYTGFTT